MKTELQIDITNVLSDEDDLEWTELIVEALDYPEMYSICSCVDCVGLAIENSWGLEAGHAYKYIHGMFVGAEYE